MTAPYRPHRLSSTAGYNEAMRSFFLCLFLALVPACRDACEARCDELEDFFGECADVLDEAGALLVCYDDEVEAFEDGSIDPTHARACTDGKDYRRSCLRVSHARANTLSATENAARLAACDQPTAWSRAVANRDCEAAAAAWSVREGG